MTSKEFILLELTENSPNTVAHSWNDLSNADYSSAFFKKRKIRLLQEKKSHIIEWCFRIYKTRKQL